MDWNSTDHDQDTVAVAITRLPARVPVTDPRYGGPVLLNPGGPGGSGIQLEILTARATQELLDAAYSGNSSDYLSTDDNAKYYDIVSFDPRGVNNTTPFHTCFLDPGEQVAWGLQGRTILGSPESNFDYLYARHEAISQGCMGVSKISNFMSTTMVVRDMVEFVERHGEWREEQANLLPHVNIATLQRTKWDKGQEPLLYWGFSYGTVLGATFAAMQPHRVKRVLLDSNVDSENYYGGLWSNPIIDSDRVMSRFFEYCAAAGPLRCAFSDGGSTSHLIHLWDTLEQDLTLNGPIVVPGQGIHGPQVITLSDLKRITRMATYQPMAFWENFASLTGPLLKRNGTAMAEWKRKEVPIYSGFPSKLANHRIDPHDPSTMLHTWAVPFDHFQAIACGDKHVQYNKTTFQELWHKYKASSRFSGDAWATLMMTCVAWPGRPKWQFADQQPVASNVTAHPILFVNNLLDNVTPARSAHIMHGRFKGSGLLEVDGEGHCTTNSPSFCLGQAVREYFQTGKLPQRDSPCLPQRRPFLGATGPRTEPLPERMQRDEQSIVNALEQLWK